MGRILFGLPTYMPIPHHNAQPNFFSPKLVSTVEGALNVPVAQIKPFKVYTINWKIRMPPTAQRGQYVGLNYTSHFVGDDGAGLNDHFTWHVLIK
jgi:hypothetical protein